MNLVGVALAEPVHLGGRLEALNFLRRTTALFLAETIRLNLLTKVNKYTFIQLNHSLQMLSEAKRP